MIIIIKQMAVFKTGSQDYKGNALDLQLNFKTIITNGVDRIDKNWTTQSKPEKWWGGYFWSYV